MSRPASTGGRGAAARSRPRGAELDALSSIEREALAEAEAEADLEGGESESPDRTDGRRLGAAGGQRNRGRFTMRGDAGPRDNSGSGSLVYASGKAVGGDDLDGDGRSDGASTPAQRSSLFAGRRAPPPPRRESQASGSSGTSRGRGAGRRPRRASTQGRPPARLGCVSMGDASTVSGAAGGQRGVRRPASAHLHRGQSSAVAVDLGLAGDDAAEPAAGRRGHVRRHSEAIPRQQLHVDDLSSSVTGSMHSSAGPRRGLQRPPSQELHQQQQQQQQHDMGTPPFGSGTSRDLSGSGDVGNLPRSPSATAAMLPFQAGTAPRRASTKTRTRRASIGNLDRSALSKMRRLSEGGKVISIEQLRRVSKEAQAKADAAASRSRPSTGGFPRGSSLERNLSPEPALERGSEEGAESGRGRGERQGSRRGFMGLIRTMSKHMFGGKEADGSDGDDVGDQQQQQ